MKPSFLWIIGDAGWNEGSLACRWACEVLRNAGYPVTVQPLKPPAGPPIPWPSSINVAPPLMAGRQWLRPRQGTLARLMSSFDRIVSDMDLRTEFQVLECLDPSARAYLFARQADIPGVVDVSAYARFDGVLTISRMGYRAVFSRRPVLESRLWLLPPLVDWGLWRALERAPIFDTAGPVLAVAGVLNATKGLDALINAVTVLRDRGRVFSLMVLGDGPDGARLRAYAQTLGIHAHFVSQPSGWGAWIKRANLLVAPQFQDGMAFDVDAALAVGTPIVATALPVIEERLPDLARDRLMKDPTVMNLVELLETPRVYESMPPIVGPERLNAWLSAFSVET